MNTTDSNTTIALLKALLAEADANLATLRKDIEANEALPKGTKGKKATAAALSVGLEVQTAQRRNLFARLEEALQPIAAANARQMLLDAVSGTTLLKQFVGKDNYANLVTHNGRTFVVKGRNLESSIELEAQHSPEEVIAYATKRLAETEKSKAYYVERLPEAQKNGELAVVEECQKKIASSDEHIEMLKEWLAEPTLAPYGQFGYSVDVRKGWGDKPWSISTSCFSGDIEDTDLLIAMLHTAKAIHAEASSVSIPQDLYKQCLNDLIAA